MLIRLATVRLRPGLIGCACAEVEVGGWACSRSQDVHRTWLSCDAFFRACTFRTSAGRGGDAKAIDGMCVWKFAVTHAIDSMCASQCCAAPCSAYHEHARHSQNHTLCRAGARANWRSHMLGVPCARAKFAEPHALEGMCLRKFVKPHARRTMCTREIRRTTCSVGHVPAHTCAATCSD